MDPTRLNTFQKATNTATTTSSTPSANTAAASATTANNNVLATPSLQIQTSAPGSNKTSGLPNSLLEGIKPTLEEPSKEVDIQSPGDALAYMADVSSKMSDSWVKMGSATIQANAAKSKQARSIRQKEIEKQAHAMQKAQNKAHKLGALGKIFNFLGAVTGIGNMMTGAGLFGVGAMAMFLPPPAMAVGPLLMAAGLSVGGAGAMMTFESTANGIGSMVNPGLLAKMQSTLNPITQMCKLSGMSEDKADLLGGISKQLIQGVGTGLMLGPFGMVGSSLGSVAQGGIMVGKAAVQIDIAKIQREADQHKIKAETLKHILSQIQMEDKEANALIKAQYENQQKTFSTITDTLTDINQTQQSTTQNI